MTRVLAVALVSLTLASPAALAETQLQRLVKKDLEAFGFSEVDVKTLSTAQLAAIHHVANEKRGEGGRRGMIRSILGGPYSLRGLFK